MIKRVMAALMMLTVPQAVQADDSELIGKVLGSGGDQTVNGWSVIGGGFYTALSYGEGRTIMTSVCCTAVLQKGSSYTIAVTTPLAREKTGGVLANRIDKAMIVKFSPEYYTTECQLLWMRPIVHFTKDKSDYVTSYFYDGKDFRRLDWIDKEGTCYRGE